MTSKTKPNEDVTKRTYGNPHIVAHSYDPGKCAEAVTTPGDWWNHQCNHKPLSPSLYCKRHEPARKEALGAAERDVWRLESNVRSLDSDLDRAAREIADSVMHSVEENDMLAVAGAAEVMEYMTLYRRWETARLALAEAKHHLKTLKAG